jgi:hypothetical protein
VLPPVDPADQVQQRGSRTRAGADQLQRCCEGDWSSTPRRLIRSRRRVGPPGWLTTVCAVHDERAAPFGKGRRGIDQVFPQRLRRRGARHRNCNVNLDDLGGVRPDLDCEHQHPWGIPRNLQLDETVVVLAAAGPGCIQR